MTFTRILEFMTEQAEKASLPIYFGNDASLNVQVNSISGMFLTFDVPGGSMNQEPPALRRYQVVLQCLDESFYMRTDLFEIGTLQRTDKVINQIASQFVCNFEVSGITFEKVQGIYDSVKSGWRARFSITDNIINYE